MIYLRWSINERGYALIEVVFLIAVIAILSATVIPKIGNELQVAQADYLMKSLYVELRFMQVSIKTSTYKKEDVLPTAGKKISSFVVVGNNTKKQYRIRLNDDEELRKYKLPYNFSFANNFFLGTTYNGTLSDSLNNKNSDTIKLIDNKGKSYKPFIVFDSVGRIRFSNGNDNS